MRNRLLLILVLLLVTTAAHAQETDPAWLEVAGEHDVNWRDESGQTALAAAAARGQDVALRQLLAAGADPHLADAAGRSPLLLAAANGHLGALGVLHEAGADLNQLDHEGHSALTRAAANGQAFAVARLLLSKGTDVQHRLPASGHNALHLAAAAGHEDVIVMLLLHKTNPEAQDAWGYTPLQLAEAAGHEQVAQYLRMAEGPGWKVTRWSIEPTEVTEFLAAAESGDLAGLERFMDSGALHYAVDEGGRSALMLAARAGQRHVALRLLLAGADPNFKESWRRDETALFFTLREGFDDLSAMLLLRSTGTVFSGRESMMPLLWAAGYGREAVVHLLLGMRDGHNRPIDVNVSDFSGKTPLIRAVDSGHVKLVEILLAAGANPNVRAGPPSNPYSALDLCRVSGNREICNLLLEAGAEA